MIRFINLTNQITEDTKEFAFYNTVTDKFIEFSENQTWQSIDDFIQDYIGDEINRYLKLIPKNFLNKE